MDLNPITPERITLVLFECALELVPQTLAHHPAVIKQKKRERFRGNPILDIAFHHTAMNSLTDREKRGRPDIVHSCLLWLSSSFFWDEERLRVFVHTINDYYFEVPKEWRIPPNQIRFNGLMRKLFEKGELKFDSQRVVLRKNTIDQIRKFIMPTFTILFSKSGERMRFREISKLILSKNNPLLLVGGYQRGEINPQIMKLADRTISLSDKTLSSLAVTSRLITALELVEDVNTYK